MQQLRLGLNYRFHHQIDRLPLLEIIARKIIELAQRGERDPVQLREYAIDFLSR